MKKKHHYRMLFVLLAAGLLCSCGTAAKRKLPGWKPITALLTPKRTDRKIHSGNSE